MEIEIADMEGNALESGQAAESPSGRGRWLYTATIDAPVGTPVRIALTAKDRPAHKGGLTQEKAL